MSDAQRDFVRFSYRKIRDITTPEEQENGATSYIAVIPSREILKVGTEGNLRSYVPDHPGKKRSFVHKQIESTIVNRPERFCQLNSGFLVAGSKAEVDDNKKSIIIYHASLNNGAQSQGEVRRYYEENEDAADFSVRVEFSLDPDEAMRTEIAIARNTATRVQDISQAGKRGYFNDLSNSFSQSHPNLKLATSETHIGDEFVDTRLLLQVLWAMLPKSLMPASRISIESRMRAYKNAASCLSDFEDIYREKDNNEEQKERYKYFVDMAGTAWTTYLKWTQHPEWARRYLREDAKQVKRRGDHHVVADGLVFPILAALSSFVEFDNLSNKWKLNVPTVFRDEDMIEAARRQLKQHQGKPVYMGRSGAAYEGLMLLTEMAVRFGEQSS